MVELCSLVTYPLLSLMAWRSWGHSASHMCPSLSPASVLALHWLHLLASPLLFLSLSHFLQSGSVQEGERRQILGQVETNWKCFVTLNSDTNVQAYLSQGPAYFCHHTLDVFFGAAVFSQDPQCSPVDPEVQNGHIGHRDMHTALRTRRWQTRLKSKKAAKTKSLKPDYYYSWHRIRGGTLFWTFSVFPFWPHHYTSCGHLLSHAKLGVCGPLVAMKALFVKTQINFL